MSRYTYKGVSFSRKPYYRPSAPYEVFHKRGDYYEPTSPAKAFEMSMAKLDELSRNKPEEV